MYEFQPVPQKKRVYLRIFLASFFGCAFFGVSQIPSIPIPSLWQTGMILSFGCAILFWVNGLMRSYVYKVSPREDIQTETPDFTITEIYGKRITTVCRVSIDEITEILPADAKTRKTCKKEGLYYRYAVVSDKAERKILKMQTGGQTVFTEIVANETLLNCFSPYKKQKKS